MPYDRFTIHFFKCHFYYAFPLPKKLKWLSTVYQNKPPNLFLIPPHQLSNYFLNHFPFLLQCESYIICDGHSHFCECHTEDKSERTVRVVWHIRLWVSNSLSATPRLKIQALPLTCFVV